MLPRVEESKAMEQSIARLAKEITTLKANLEAANKSAHTQIAKIARTPQPRERRDHRLDFGAADRDRRCRCRARRRASPRSRPPPARPPVVQDWTIRDARDGFVYVQGHGDIYQVVPGAPLPGLGPVESVKRQDGRWMVVTPKGIIVSMRDRRYFESF